jgi:hypothetical protein
MAASRRTGAFTRTELVVVIAVLVVLVSMLKPASQRANHQRAERIYCVNNLKQIGAAYRIWANDNGDHFPSYMAITNGGWSNLLSRSDASTYAWTNDVIMANELERNPRVLICPADERQPANACSNLANANISYFVGVNANDTYPQSLLGGDRNLGPGTTPDPDYGYSPTNGHGNDVLINGPVCWSLKMHSRGNNAGAGNILLGDGSAQQATSSSPRENWLKNDLAAKTAFTKDTNSPPVRLIFP